jgi:hypothetical protein
MNNVALTKTDRTKQVGAVLWLIVRKFFLGVLTLLKKINWKKVGFISWKIAVLLFAIAIAFGKLFGSMIAGLYDMMRNNSKADEVESGWVQGDDFYDPSSLNPQSLVQLEESEKRRWHE